MITKTTQLTPKQLVLATLDPKSGFEWYHTEFEPRGGTAWEFVCPFPSKPGAKYQALVPARSLDELMSLLKCFFVCEDDEDLPRIIRHYTIRGFNMAGIEDISIDTERKSYVYHGGVVFGDGSNVFLDMSFLPNAQCSAIAAQMVSGLLDQLSYYIADISRETKSEVYRSYWSLVWFLDNPDIYKSPNLATVLTTLCTLDYSNPEIWPVVDGILGAVGYRLDEAKLRLASLIGRTNDRFCNMPMPSSEK